MSKQSFSMTDFEAEWFPREDEGNVWGHLAERLESDRYNALEDLLANGDYRRAVHIKNQIDRMLDHYLEVKRCEKFHSQDKS